MENTKPHGWKTYLAGGAAILGGLYAVTNGDYETGLEGVIAGLALLGIGHKLAKLIQTFQQR